MALLEQLKADTKKDLMQQVEVVIDKRVQVADRIDKLAARATRVESSVEALAASNKNLSAVVTAPTA